MSSRLGREIISFWGRNPGQRFELGGLSPSASAYVVANLLAETDRRIAVVCPTSDAAARLHQDLKTYLVLLSKADIVAHLEFFPGWEHSPYRAFNPSIKNRIRRLRVLHRIRGGQLRAIITDAAALAQRCPEPERLAERTFRIAPGDFLVRDEMVRSLEHGGYTRSDPVEDPGTYAIRGNLIDIFSPTLRKPLRIECFGDEIETIRAYDPASQRSEPTPLALADVVPVTDWTFNPASVAAAKAGIKEFCDEYGIPKRARDTFFERLDAGARDPWLDYLHPFFTGAPGAWLPDYLGTGWSVAVCDSLGVEASYDALFEDLREGFERSRGEGKVCAPAEWLYAGTELFSSFLKTRPELILNEIGLGVPEARTTGDDASDDLAANSPSSSGKLFAKLVRNDDLRPAESIPVASKDHHKAALDGLAEKDAVWTARGYARVVVASTASQAERTSFLLHQKKVPCRLADPVDWSDVTTLQIAEGTLSSGFRLAFDRVALVTDSEIFGPKKLRSASASRPAQPDTDVASFISSLEELNPDDLVVHLHHGIGRYRGLVKIAADLGGQRIDQDFLFLEYSGSDKLYLPVYRLDQVQRYLGAQDSVALDRLGSAAFEKTKAKVKQDLQALAHELLQIYAKRASRHGFAFSPPGEIYREFEARFPFVETPDQLKAIEDVASDMESSKIMDRLVCGDVGYGKTEVAMRAAYRAVMDGKQVAVLVPTTVLALQHERSFRERFRDTAATIGVLSRFKTPKESKDTIAGLKEGKVDVVIGTHRLLSKDVGFKDLGLLIVDEEQRFGVEHKERVKNLKIDTDVLTLTATPIPRTLHLSLMGLRDISVINTAPIDRLSVRTYVARFDEDVIRRAIQQEVARGGQVFFIHNRVQSIDAMADRLRAIVPGARILVAHGQLDERELEKRMLAFYNKEADVLLCSTIIESGLDIPSANTMIINRADAFGLAQLYQLRGRVGRSQLRAYCYLLLPEEGAVTDDAKQRLEVIQRFVDLGSGFRIASHDLELRGGGDILGKSQSGHIAAVGYELYTELLDETIRELRGQPVEDHFDPEIKIPVTTLLPEEYVPDVHQRLGFYKRLSAASTTDQLHALELELQDRYGKPPAEVQNLIWLIRIKQQLRAFHVKSLVAGKERTSLEVSHPGEAGGEAKLSPQKMLALVQREPKSYALTPDSKIILKRPFQSAQQLLQDVQNLFSQVAEPQDAC